MAGLLDFLQTPEGQGLLSGVASYAMNARRGTPINNIGRGLGGGLMGYQSAIGDIEAQKEKAFNQQYRQMQMDNMLTQAQQAKDAQAREAALRAKVAGGLKMGTPALPPATPVDDNGYQMPEVAGTQPTFFGRPVDDMTAAMLPELDPKEALSMFKPKEPMKARPGDVFLDPGTGEQKFSVPEKIDYNKPFLPDGSPNPAYQEYATKKARAGAARMSQNNFGEPKPYWNQNTQRYEFYQYDKQGNPRSAQLPAGVMPADEGKLPEAQVKQIVGIKSLQGAIGEYQNALKGWKKTSVISPDARADMGVKYNNMMLQAKEAYNLGVLNGPDFEILTSVVTDPRSMMGTITSNSALDKQASELSRIMGNVSKGVSVKPRPQTGESKGGKDDPLGLRQ